MFSSEPGNSDSANNNKTFSKLDDALNETKKRVAILAAAVESDHIITDGTRNAVWTISRCYFDWSSWRNEVCNVLCDVKYPEIAKKMSKQLFETGPAVDDATGKFSLNLLYTLVHFSKSENFRKALNLIPLFLDYLVTVNIFLEHLATQSSPESYPSHKWAIVKAVASVLYQLAKPRDNNIIAEFISNKGIEVFEKLSGVENYGVQLVSVCCLVIIGDGEKHFPPSKIGDYSKIILGAIDFALKDVENPFCHGLELREIAELLCHLLIKSSGQQFNKETGNSNKLSNKAAAIRLVTEMIVDNSEAKRKCGTMLFRAYCPKDFNADWLRSVYKFVTSGNENDQSGNKTAIWATEFLTEYQVWLKTRLGEPIGDKNDLSAIEMTCFTTKLNGSIKTLEDLIAETEIRVKFLAKLAKLSPDRLISEQSEMVFEELRISHHYFVKWRPELLATALREGLPAISVKYLEHLFSVGLEKRKKFAITLLQMYWNFTDFSPHFRIDLTKAGGLKLLLDYLKRQSDNKTRTDAEAQIISVIINVVYNMSRSIELKAEFLQLNADSILKEYLGMSENIKLVVVLCLAHTLADTPEAAQLANEQGVVSNLVKYINIAMARPDRKCRMSDNKFAGIYSLEELVEGIALLAVSDSIKETLIQNNVCSIAGYLLKSGDPSLEVVGAELLWTLSFEQTARDKIIASDEKLISSLRQLSDSAATTPRVREHATKALSFIEKWQDKVAEASNNAAECGSAEGHIFISYSWKQQATALKIKQELLKHGYTVWMDVEKMHGDLLEAMANAIEKASIVILCFSSTYKQSNPCRTEAQYAHALCKPILPVNMEYHYFPDGWLGILVRARKYIDLSLEKNPFEVAIGQLMKELKALGAAESSQSIKEPLGGGHGPTLQQKKSVPSNKTFTGWTVEEVGKWLEREDLTEFEATFSKFDGKMLNTLVAMKSTAPEFYHQTISKYCCNNTTGTLYSLVRLLGALDRLLLE